MHGDRAHNLPGRVLKLDCRNPITVRASGPRIHVANTGLVSGFHTLLVLSSAAFSQLTISQNFIEHIRGSGAMVLKGSGTAPQAMFWKFVGVLLVVKIITGGRAFSGQGRRGWMSCNA